jgi:hypothetical protein
VRVTKKKKKRLSFFIKTMLIIHIVSDCVNNVNITAVFIHIVLNFSNDTNYHVFFIIIIIKTTQ